MNIWNDIGDGASAQSLPAISANDWRYYRQHTTRFVDFGAAVGGAEMGGLVLSAVRASRRSASR